MPAELELVSRSPDQTKKLAATIAGALRPGDLVALTGELGAGKTCFVQGAAASLGVTDRVTSPSFLLRREYEGRVPVLHMDHLELEFHLPPPEDDIEGTSPGRRIVVRPRGEDWLRRFPALAADLQPWAEAFVAGATHDDRPADGGSG